MHETLCSLAGFQLKFLLICMTSKHQAIRHMHSVVVNLVNLRRSR